MEPDESSLQRPPASLHDKKFEAALEELRRPPMRPGEYLPWTTRALRRTGLAVRPPHHASFVANTLVRGALFAAFWGLIMWFWSWSGTGTAWWGALASALVAGLMFGAITARHYRATAKRYGLSTWEERSER